MPDSLRIVTPPSAPGHPATERARRSHFAAALALNAPFVLCHPDWPLLTVPMAQSLVVGAVLFLVPGLPLSVLLIRAGWMPRLHLLWVMALSLLTFLGVLVAAHLSGVLVDGGVLWTGTWGITNLALLGNLFGGGAPILGMPGEWGRWRALLLVFLGAYVAFHLGATRVVPVLADQDDEVQGTTYGLIVRLKPSLRTGRNTNYHFAHPPLVHLYVAGSMVYHDLLDALAVYDSESGQRTPRELFEHYRRHPYLRETRGPNVFVAALTVAVLAGWGWSATGPTWLGVLLGAAYASTTEVFVRSAYGGYFALSTFLLLQILLAVERFAAAPGRFTRTTGVAAGLLAALTDHKMVIVAAGVSLWAILRSGAHVGSRAMVRTAMHPVVVGFLVGTILFWIYGLAVSASDFWMDHVRHHLVDRVLHNNARGLDMSVYPGVAAVWLELLQHTGWLLVPAGALALIWLCSREPVVRGAGDAETAGWRGLPGLLALWVVLIAVAFSVIDWRQTKHFAPLVLPLFLALGRAARHRALRPAVVCVLALMLAWNLRVLAILAADFGAIAVTPEW